MNNTIGPSLPKGTLPDDSDRASKLVGYNINEYVFGDTLTKSSDNKTDTKPLGSKKASKLTGALALLGTGLCAYFGIKGLKRGSLPKFITKFTSKG